MQMVKDGNTTNYTYNSNNQLLTETTGGITVTYSYDGDQIIADYNNSGVLQRKYVYGPGIDEPICMIAGGNTYYYHFDGLGSVTMLTDSGGQKVVGYRYDAFGTPTQTNYVASPPVNRFMFTGREYDNDSLAGLYYYRARYYKPSIGRFLQPDPIGYVDGMNLYTFVSNNPIIYVDVDGLAKRKKEAEAKDCLKGCEDIHRGMISPTGCMAKCAKGGATAASACLMAAKKGLEVCVLGCTLSDDLYDPRPPGVYAKGRDGVYKACGCK